MVPGITKTFANLFLSIGTDSSTTSRTGAFGSAVPFISQHPLFGTGFATFKPSIYFYTDDQYLNSAIEIGLVGVLCLIILFITGWVTARRARKASADPAVRHLGQCLAASCATMTIGYVNFDAFYFPMAAGITFLTLGCAGALYRLAQQDAAAPSPAPEFDPYR
jgi:O-antigen ligase